MDETARGILGVAPVATPDELKRAYHRLALKYHPDRNRDDKDAQKRFIAIKCAYQCLCSGDCCESLLAGAETETPMPGSEYNLDNAWGMFLWWRETYFS